MTIQHSEVSHSTDVLVAGGGMAGIAAAVAAARTGAEVTLVERGGTLGGVATAGLMCSFMGVDRSIIGGIMWEFLDRLKAVGGSIEGLYTPFDPELFKTVALEMVSEAGVRLLLHSWVLDSVVENQRIEGVRFVTKSGIKTISAKVVVDCTGDGDVAASAGAAFESRRPDGNAGQPMTLMFRMGNVDTKQLIEYYKANPDEFYQEPMKCLLEEDRDPPLFVFAGFFSLIKKAKESGGLYLARESMGLQALPNTGQILVNATRVQGLDAVDAGDLTKAEVDARKQAASVVRFMKDNLPGFADAHLIDTAASIGVRESRRIIGRYMLTKEDILAERRFESAVARNFFPMDNHGPAENPNSHSWTVLQPGGFYEIPYSCLVPQDLDGMLLGGRCISASHEAHASTRSMPCCVATGQAAGTAAALSARGNAISPAELDIEQLRTTLAAQNVVL
ncbi:FAD-dependent oxidoreductase [Pseudohoeflea coraliihabitans]|uniref:FAD-dependent oxidoreductase n=1 Tax=Pseudohoeflea coraliihabitans TaxID=2860393 RepID=A0ABS6WML1_9HYPH|nr:FAD-dependent oxidoreductase [Pseudohoeflea sp. DP4N28-3]MBW3097206.1 FAD-dependent oxidoreductase [Pseudohoeflea sp. DP4N28-3]